MDRDELRKRIARGRALVLMQQYEDAYHELGDMLAALAAVPITPDEYEQVGWVDGGAFWRPEGAPRLLGDVPVYVKRIPPDLADLFVPHSCLVCGSTEHWGGDCPTPPVAPEPERIVSDAEVVEFHMTHPPVAPPEPLVPEKEVCPHRVVDPDFGCVRCGETAWIGPPVAPEPEGTCPECNGTGGGPVRVAGDEWELQECGACGGVRVVPVSPTKENER